MSVDSLTPSPSCSNDTLIFNCEVDRFFLIGWNHVAFEEIEFVGSITVVGNTSTTSDGQVVANLTRRTLNVDGRYLLSSTLIIHPPLNSLKLNNTNITCKGSESIMNVTPISLYGK